MQKRISRKVYQYHFNSLSELGDHIANAPRTWGHTASAEGHDAEMRWDLEAGFAGAVRMARNGWLEGAERVQEALKAFATATPEPDTRNDVYGFRPHVPRFCAGAPDSMIRHATVADSGMGKVLTLAVQIGMSYGTDAKCAANFGVAVAQYVNQLEMEGTRVELLATYSCMWNTGANVTFCWTVKNADQPLDLAVIAFAIGHPAMFRRIIFAAMERSELSPWSGYGAPVNTKVSDIINAPLGTVVLNGMTSANECAPTAAKALEYVSQQIEQAIEAQHND